MASTSRALRVCRSRLAAGSTSLPASSVILLSRRGIASTASVLAAPANSATMARTKQSSGFGSKKKQHSIRSGGSMAPMPLSENSSSFRNQNPSTALPQLASVEINPSLRARPVAFGSGKGSLQETFGVPRSLREDRIHMDQAFSIIRDISLSSFKQMDAASQSESRQNRYVLTGEKGSGKSVTLLQTAEYCARHGWAVFYVPRAIDWVNSTTTFQYDAKSGTFIQSALARELLSNFAKFNANVLSALKTPKEIVLDRTTIAAGAKLAELVDAGVMDPNSSMNVLRETLEILAKQQEVPVLLAVDDIQAIFGQSRYRDPDFNYIQALHLSVPRLVLEYVSGQKSFGRGAIFGALSSSSREFPVPLELLDGLGRTPQRAGVSWAERHPEYSEYAKGLVPVEVPSRLTVQEGAALMEVWAQNGVLHSDLNDSTFLAKLTETGGNPREFRRGMRTTLVTW